MSCVVVIGAQWGDEGKGKIIDIYTEFAEMVVRYAGGSNAGHTLVVGDEKIVGRLLPSGILREGTRCLLGQGMVVDPAVLLGEVDELIGRGRKHVASQVKVSTRAHLIMPYHLLVDALRESRASEGKAIGTTKKGIGPAYEDKIRRNGVRLGELRNFAKLTERVENALEAWAPVIRDLGGEVPSVESVVEPLRALADRVIPMLADTSELLDDAVKKGAKILLEGAQGTLLDVDHGTYPFVTSSSPIAGGATTGAGIGPNRISTVVGIAKAYTTRVGGGPVPPAQEDDEGRHLQKVGAEFGSVTGRARRAGWLDLPALRYAVRVNGIDGIALTKLDVLTGIARPKICVAYETPEGRTDSFPIDELDDPRVQPIYEELEGWTESISDVRQMSDLPAAALAYVKFIEDKAGVPAYLVSVGPRRDETIVIRNPLG